MHNFKMRYTILTCILTLSCQPLQQRLRSKKDDAQRLPRHPLAHRMQIPREVPGMMNLILASLVCTITDLNWQLSTVSRCIPGRLHRLSSCYWQASAHLACKNQEQLPRHSFSGHLNLLLPRTTASRWPEERTRCGTLRSTSSRNAWT